MVMQEGAQKEFHRIANDFQNSYVMRLDQSDRKGVIKGDVIKLCEQSPDLSTCLTKSRKETDTSIDDAYRALVEMSKTFRTDRKQFVKSYAEFGEAWLSSPFTFQTFFNLFKNDGLVANLEIATGKTDKLTVGYEWR